MKIRFSRYLKLRGYWRSIPFCPDSLKASDQLPEEISKAPPTEDIDPVVEPRLGWYRPLELGLCDESYLGNGCSLLDDEDAGENSGEAALSTDFGGAGVDMMFLSRPARPLQGSSAVSITSTTGHRGIIAGGG